MNIFLINCSNLKKGGGLQVGDSVCACAGKMTAHRFVVVLSSYMDETARRVESFANVRVVRHDICNDWRTLVLGRDEVLDKIVEEEKVNAVLTIFGPARWEPRCPHLCGFARAHLISGDSPYYKRMSYAKRMKEKSKNAVLSYFFRRGVTCFWTENPYITTKVRKKWRHIPATTVTNYYNQIFDQPSLQKLHSLPTFSGCTLLSVNAPYPHKNLGICIDITRILVEKHPQFQFRFVLTAQEIDLPPIPSELQSHFLLIGRGMWPSVHRCISKQTLCFSRRYWNALQPPMQKQCVWIAP